MHWRREPAPRETSVPANVLRCGWPPARSASGQGAGRVTRATAGRGAGARIRPYLTLPAVRPPTRRFSMSMNRMTTGMIATIETPNT